MINWSLTLVTEGCSFEELSDAFFVPLCALVFDSWYPLFVRLTLSFFSSVYVSIDTYVMSSCCLSRRSSCCSREGVKFFYIYDTSVNEWIASNDDDDELSTRRRRQVMIHNKKSFTFESVCLSIVFLVSVYRTSRKNDKCSFLLSSCNYLSSISIAQ